MIDSFYENIVQTQTSSLSVHYVYLIQNTCGQTHFLSASCLQNVSNNVVVSNHNALFAFGCKVWKRAWRIVVLQISHFRSSKYNIGYVLY